MDKLNRKQRRALKHSKIGHTPEYIRLVKQRQAISRTTIHYRYDITPSVVNRYMGINRTVCISKIVRTANLGSFLPKALQIPKL